MSSQRLFCLPLLVGAFGLLALLPAAAELRTFTDRQGRELEAEITAVEGTKVTLRLASGKSYTLPIAKLSDTDQLFIDVWKDLPKDGAAGKSGSEKRKPSIPSGIAYAIEIEVDKERVKKGSTQEGDMGEVTPEDWIFEVALENRSRAELEGLEISYRIYVDPKASAKLSPIEPPRVYGHRAEVETMADGATLVIKTEAVTLNELELNPDFVFTDGSRSDLEDDLEGIWIKLWHGERKVAEYKSGGSTLKKAEWPDDEPAAPEEQESE